jgi:uroporphyrinogen decarboxylase
MHDSLFLQACRGESTARPPIWIMRQAGRYLPEYRAVRQKVDFLTLCRTPELAAEVTLQPIRRFGFDASIVFSDIMMPLEAMGVHLQFNPGPVVMEPIRHVDQVDALRVPEPDSVAPYVAETIKLLRRELPVPLIGFAGAPLTLAAYLIEGKGSKDFAKMRSFLHAQPEAAHKLLDKLADCMLSYLTAQVHAGAQVVQLFDSWAGVLSCADYRRFALPAVHKILRGLAPLGVPRIYFANNGAALWPAVREVEAEVLGVDWRSSLQDVRKAVGEKFVLQGNLDPAALFAPPAAVTQLARQVLTEGGGKRHIFNLGHGILPETPIASVEALIQTVHESENAVV